MFGETKTCTYRFLRNPEETASIQPQFHPAHHNTENCSVSLKLTNHGATFNVVRRHFVACENIRFSSLFADGEVSRGGTSATQRQKFHTDDANQCLHNKSSSHKFVQLYVFSGRFWYSVLSKSSSKTQMLLQEKTIFQKY